MIWFAAIADIVNGTFTPDDTPQDDQPTASPEAVNPHALPWVDEPGSAEVPTLVEAVDSLRVEMARCRGRQNGARRHTPPALPLVVVVDYLDLVVLVEGVERLVGYPEVSAL